MKKGSSWISEQNADKSSQCHCESQGTRQSPTEVVGDIAQKGLLLGDSVRRAPACLHVAVSKKLIFQCVGDGSPVPSLMFDAVFGGVITRSRQAPRQSASPYGKKTTFHAQYGFPLSAFASLGMTFREPSVLKLLTFPKKCLLAVRTLRTASRHFNGYCCQNLRF